ncbi:acetyltransferase, GNAT family [Gleimia coleocanis DSM 15436]|uniref:Acetyltransferase, GNAT family n=1 Tax=Gleimia coleocanis DSM 15436 TaxID=525245 RepID=C0W287_9ACTO|nr:GNAT family protein [Gleimia coleocanis]EEH63301.1 acetyltransferase, GNAT family [Gleimia coleocanis DSM 15436]
MWLEKLLVYLGVSPRHGFGIPLADLELYIPDPVSEELIADPGFPVSQLWLKPVVGPWHEQVARLRVENLQWLQPWEVSVPEGYPVQVPSVSQYRRLSDLRLICGQALAYLVCLDSQPVGLITVTNVERGAQQSATLGYWISESFAGLGVMSAAVAAVTDFLLDVLHLHRVEVFIRPENEASLRLVESLGFVSEGVRRNYLWVDGAWRDHRVYAAERESWFN